MLFRFIILTLLLISLSAFAEKTFDRNASDIGPNDVDWDGYYTTANGEKIYCSEAFREKRKQYAIKKQRERTTNWIIACAIILPSFSIGYVVYKKRKEKALRKAEEEGRLKRLKEEQDRQKKEAERLENLRKEREKLEHETTDRPTISGITEDLKRKEEQTQQGLAYEQHIGYLLETKGHIVFYRGAYANEKDKGVDLIAIKNNHIRLIQCKCFNNNLPIEQIEKYLKHIRYEWENVFGSPIQDIPHTWGLYCTSGLSKGASRTCCNNNIECTNLGTGIPPLIKAFHFEGKKRYMLPNQQFYNYLISYIDGHNHKRFYKTQDAEAAGFTHLQLIDINTANLINQETITTYSLTHPQTPLETLKRSWLDF